MVSSKLLLPFTLIATALGATVSKRDSTERAFLVNCAYTADESDGVSVTPSSKMFYYSTDAARFSGEPNDFVVLTPSSYVTWEGNSVSGTFSDGDVCVSNIEAGAQELSNFALAGTVYNSYRGFNCYRIDGRVLTYVESPNGFFQGVCNSIYYCMDA